MPGDEGKNVSIVSFKDQMREATTTAPTTEPEPPRRAIRSWSWSAGGGEERSASSNFDTTTTLPPAPPTTISSLTGAEEQGDDDDGEIPFWAGSSVPMAEALPWTDPAHDNNNVDPEERRLQMEQRNLELQLALEQQRAANQHNNNNNNNNNIADPGNHGGGGLRHHNINKRWRKWAVRIIVLVVLLFCAATAICWWADDGSCMIERSSDSDAAAPPVPKEAPTATSSMSPAPSLSARSKLEENTIVSFIKRITGTIPSSTTQPPQYPATFTPEERALSWLVEDDRSTNFTDETALRQRYVLATLWLQTSRPPNLLMAVSEETEARSNGTHQQQQSKIPWTTPHVSECEWFGVTCDGTGLITGLSLEYGSLRGHIPANLALLSGSLTHVDLTQNLLAGTIPPSLSALTVLTRLELGLNDLMGSIPSSLMMSAWTDMLVLGLSGNDLTGTIPSSLESMTALRGLFLAKNRLTGTVPAFLGALTALTELYLDENNLTGTIPTSLGALTVLKGLSLRGNQLTGTVPSSLGALTALTELSVRVNRLTGTIPSSWSAQTALTELSLQDNRFTGTIPSSLTALTALHIASFNNNRLNGTMPFCKSSSNSSSLDEDPTTMTPSWGKLAADCNEVNCPCCTTCCPTGGWKGIPSGTIMTCDDA